MRDDGIDGDCVNKVSVAGFFGGAANTGFEGLQGM